ncbi:tRNA1(Val) (adenine(37)-N6)-methyltransferase [Paenibacillus alkalitolerans]|uniref:tRNA1(Val) (adenine(37)-N6)-methyltransferase n=1 Tax=Paenibacillus alkalitolerans TaxID=2799335 RepID=UPI0018F27AFE|nr:tRNA1(Val) (adenine(37)-N6)-methyltransferase [Paenibacillus alkalitolerans]
MNAQVDLKPHERIDDLLTHDLKIIQSDDIFSFSLDAVLLARFCSVPPKGRIVDLCTGNGVIPLLMSTRTKGSIVGVEIQPRVADMASRNVRLNGLDHRIQMVCGDLKQFHLTAGYGSFDLVTVNPPYLPVAAGDRKLNPHVAAARHEVYCTLADVASAASRLVKSGGKVAMVHRPSRLAEIISEFRAVRLEPKRIRFVHPRLDEEANIVLIEAAKDGKPELRTLPPLIVHESDGSYAKELLEVYYGSRQALIDTDRGES